MERIAIIHSTSMGPNRRYWSITILPKGENIYNPHKQSCERYGRFSSYKAAKDFAEYQGCKVKI